MQDSPSPPQSCPSDDVLARLSEGRVTAAEHHAIEDHLDVCAGCRELVVELLGRSAPAVLPPRSPAPTPAGRIGRYPITGLLGAGAMGAVYLAHDPELDRKVAIKVLRPAASGAAVRDEARLLAKLSHPNVVAVYEIGEWDALDFVVMEYIDGTTVADWLRATPRTWREVVEVFVAAGRGLAAAHRAHLVHRDIKPSNLLIGHDGRVRIGDFGLARFVGGASDPGDAPAAITLAGTPAYMAPQQRAGAPADAGSDQYAFCVALHEGLFAERPGDLAAGAPGWSPARGTVPSRIRRAVLRGLRRAPRDRFPSMDALLAAIVPRTSRRWLIAATTALAALAAGGIGWRAAAPAPIDRCDGSALLAGSWGPARRLAVRAAFTGSTRSYAPDAFARVAHQLDDYADQWSAGYRQACEASRVRGEQSEALLDKRMQCLRWRRDELGQLATLLATRLDDDVLAKAISASQGLISIATCSDVQQLQALVPMPSDPARAREIEAVDAALAAVIAQTAAGKYADGLAASTQLLPRVRATGYAPLIARATQHHAELEVATGDATAAEATLHAAATAAAEAGDVPRVAAIWIALFEAVGFHQGKGDAAWALRGFAETAVTLAGRTPELRSHLLDVEADVLAERGEYQQASATHLQALSLQLVRSQGTIALARAHDGLCRSLRSAGDVAAADLHCAEAMRLFEKAFGPNHPQLGVALLNRAGALLERGEFARAHELQTRGLQLFEQAYPDDHPRVVAALNNIGAALEHEERYREALGYARRVVALRERRPAETAALANALDNLGTDEEHVGDHAAAAEHFARALQLQLAALKPNHPDILLTLVGLADVALAAHDPATAKVHALRALEIGETSLGKTHPLLVHPLEQLARLASGRGNHAAAVALLERAAALPELMPAARGYIHLELAQALWAEGRDRRRARAMAEASLTELSDKQTAEVTSWLHSHR